MRILRIQAVGSWAARLTALAALALGAALSIHASPTLLSVSPPGGQRGAAVRLQLKGNGLDGKIQIHSSIPGSMAELSAEGPAREYLLEIAADAEPGTYPLAVETPDGLTNVWLFSVSAFPETVETESERPRAPRNDTESGAQPIQTPVVVNGTLGAADRDLYRIALEAGERIVLEVEARRLGSAIDPVLAVRSPDGRYLARSDDSPGMGGDARVDLEALVDGGYLVEVHDARFSDQRRNDYRLVAGSIEYAEAMFPLGWTRGEPVEVELSGGTLESPRSVTVEGSQVAVPGGNAGLPMPLLRSSDPETLETDGTEAMPLKDGTVVNGRIAAEGEIDRFLLAVSAGEDWMIETQAAVLGTSSLYTLLVMRDQDGKKLASAGDQPPEELLSNISVRAETFGDPALGIRIPKGVSELQISVEDLLGRGGPGYGYRLVARRQPADFILRLDDTHVNIPRGGSASVSLTMDRRGFDGAVRIVAEGLPGGVVAEGGHIPAEFGGMTTQRTSLQGRLTLTADAEAESAAGPLALYGEGRTAGGTLIRRPALISKIVTPVAGMQQRPVRIPSDSASVTAVVTEPAPASIELLMPSRLRLIQGLQHDIRWAYRTHMPGVEALSPVRLINAPAVANLRILGDAKLKPGDEEGVLEMNTTMGTPAMRFDMVLQGRVRHEGVSYTIYSPAIVVDVVQGYSVGAPSAPVPAAPGGEFRIAGTFSREPEFDSEVVVEAVNLPVGVSCDSQSIDSSPAGYSLQCRAGDATAVGEYLVEIAPRSVLAGRDKEAVPYNIPPVEAVLVIAGGATIATVQ
ncbi:MAG: PPC domain-containing protein [Bryobacterales bacterium]|nr:PPC domain-containing protein [Bryobacterales bacterium]